MTTDSSKKLSIYVHHVGGLNLADDERSVIAQRLWIDTGNPMYVWAAIEKCAKTKRDFPAWVIAYLGETAQRFGSPAARTAKDFRKVLPEILGFKRKRGQRYPLRPPLEDDVLSFTLVFWSRIVRGMSPAAAIDEASKVLPAKIANKVDNKTLQRWIKKAFGITHIPRTNVGCKELIRAALDAHGRSLETIFRDSSS